MCWLVYVLLGSYIHFLVDCHIPAFVILHGVKVEVACFYAINLKINFIR